MDFPAKLVCVDCNCPLHPPVSIFKCEFNFCRNVLCWPCRVFSTKCIEHEGFLFIFGYDSNSEEDQTDFFQDSSNSEEDQPDFFEDNNTETLELEE